MTILSSIIGEVGEAAGLGVRAAGESALDARSTVLKNIAESRAAREAHNAAIKRMSAVTRMKIAGTDVSMIGGRLGREEFGQLDSTMRSLGRDYPGVMNDIDKVQIAGFGKNSGKLSPAGNSAHAFFKSKRLGIEDMPYRIQHDFARAPKPLQNFPGGRLKSSINVDMGVSRRIFGEIEETVARSSLPLMNTYPTHTNNLSNLLTHEFGHHVHNAISQSDNLAHSAISDDLAVHMYHGFGVKDTSPYSMYPPSGVVGSHIRSGYGGTNAAEAFAESFTASRMGFESQGLRNFDELVDRGLKGELDFSPEHLEHLTNNPAVVPTYRQGFDDLMTRVERPGKPRTKLKKVRPAFNRSAIAPGTVDRGIREV